MSGMVTWPPGGTKRRKCKRCGEPFLLGLSHDKRILCDDCYTPRAKTGSAKDPAAIRATRKVETNRRAAGNSNWCARHKHRKCFITICTCECHKK